MRVTPRTLTYTLPTKAVTKVDLRLHFAERAAANNTAGKRLFDIDVEGETVRRNFDIFAAAGGLNTATVLGDQQRDRQGRLARARAKATADYPAISAIEVLCQGTCPVDTTAPAAPTGLTADGTQAGVTLDWDDSPATDLVGYRVYRSASAGGTFTELTSTPVATSTYVDTTAPANTEAFYRVVAVDTSDNVSAPVGRRLGHPARARAAAGAHQHRWPGADGQRHDLVGLQQHHRVQRLGQRR